MDEWGVAALPGSSFRFQRFLHPMAGFTSVHEIMDYPFPVQVSACGMDTAELKRDFGSDIVFWGGGVATQHILPMGSTQEVREEVKKRIQDLAPGGGYVFAAVHNIQALTPPENIVAMVESVQEFG